MEIGKKIILYRALKGLTQEEFAKMVGVSTLTIHRAERNQVGAITRAKIEAIIDEEKEV